MTKWEYMTWPVGFAAPTDSEWFGHSGGRAMYVNGETVKNWKAGAKLPDCLGRQVAKVGSW